MIDFNAIPENVKKLAVECLLEHVGTDRLLAMSPPNALAVAENAGLDPAAYIGAIAWLADYNEKHAQALQRWNETRKAGRH
jgi:hypothetical protein